MSRRQYIAFGVFVIAFLTMAWGVPPLAEREDMLPGILLGAGCTAVMIVCLITGHLVNVDADFDTASEKYMEENTMNFNINNTNSTMDNPFLALDKAELEFLANTVGVMAAGALVSAAEDTNNAEVLMHEKALRKLTAILTEQVDIRNAAETRLLDAIKEETNNG